MILFHTWKKCTQQRLEGSFICRKLCQWESFMHSLRSVAVVKRCLSCDVFTPSPVEDPGAGHRSR